MFLIIIVLFIMVNVPPSQAQLDSTQNSTQPVYVVDISFPQKSITAGNIVNVTFSITGQGNFSDGTILIQSDYEMILSNTLTIQGTTFPGGLWLNQTGSDIGKQTLVAFGVGAFPFSGLNSIIGRVSVNTGGMQPGQYQFRVYFLTESGGSLNSYSDTTTFTIADFYTANQFWLYVITTSIAVISLIIGFYQISRTRKRVFKK
jgi:hypothetical protein